MHTDEYEISIGREIVLCRKVIERLRISLEEKKKQYKMTTEEFLLAMKEGQLSEENHDYRAWSADHQELLNWQQKLREYEEALETLKGI